MENVIVKDERDMDALAENLIVFIGDQREGGEEKMERSDIFTPPSEPGRGHRLNTARLATHKDEQREFRQYSAAVPQRTFISGNRKKEKAAIVGLAGNLGSGKTAFVKALGRVLNIPDIITSPTFVLERRYDIPAVHSFHALFHTLLHIDAYRLESERDLDMLGFFDYRNDAKTLIVVEWPERVKDGLPDDMIKMQFRFIDNQTREVLVPWAV